MENTRKRTGQRYWLALIAVALVGAALIPVALAKESIQVAQARPSGRAVDPPKATPAQDWSIQQQGIAPKTTTRTTPKATPATKSVVFVKRADTTLRQGPERTSTILAKLKVGEQLTVLDVAGGANLKVSTLGGLTGYVSVLNVSDVPPQVERKGPQIIIADKTTPREGDNVTPMRGLSPMAEKVGKQENAPQAALDDANKMESISSAVTNADLDQFLAEGEVVPQ